MTTPWTSYFMTIPADNDAADTNSWFKNGFAVINAYRESIRETMEVDHTWRIDTSAAHKQVTLNTQASDPVVTSGLKLCSRSDRLRVVSPSTSGYITRDNRIHYPVAVLTNSIASNDNPNPLMDEFIYNTGDYSIMLNPSGLLVPAEGIYLVSLRGPLPASVAVNGGLTTYMYVLGDDEFMGCLYLTPSVLLLIATPIPDAPARSLIMAVMRII